MDRQGRRTQRTTRKRYVEETAAGGEIRAIRPLRPHTTPTIIATPTICTILTTPAILTAPTIPTPPENPYDPEDHYDPYDPIRPLLRLVVCLEPITQRGGAK